jgi:ribosomal protein S15P/S13E
MKSKDDTLRMVLESLQSIPSNVDRAASMDTIYRKHHIESIDANNRIVKRVPNQIESISQAQTQTVEGVFELTTPTQSLGERVDILARSLAGSDHLTRVEHQVNESHARGEQQHASAVNQINALADHVRELERHIEQQQKADEQSKVAVANALAALTRQNQDIIESMKSTQKMISRDYA